ncbi:hypothetical protein DIPPA_06979 [Diplonema papillatum]|nr:hypothetical protein DIPPA_06979 [Diplonema papillatum]
MAQSDAVDRPQAPTVSVQETPCILATESPSKDRDEVASQQFYSLCGGASRCTQPSPVNNRREAFAAAKPFVAGSGFETVKAGSVEYLCSEISRLQQALEDKENECTTALQKYDDLLRGHIEGFGKLGGAPAVIQRVSELQARLSDSAKERTTLQQQVSSLDSELLALARMLEATKREAALTAAAAEAAINHKSQEAQELQHANAQLVDQQLLKRLHLSNVGTNTAPDLGAVDSSEEMAQERLRWHRQLEYYHDREQHLLQQVNGLQQSLSSLSAENERNAKLEHSSRSTHQPHENHMPPPATTKVMMLPADIAETFEAAQSDLHEHLLHLREKLVANHMEGQAVQHRDFERRLRALSKGVEGQLESLQHASNLQESYVQGKACLMELDAVMKALKDEQKEKEANRLARESDFGEFAATKPLFDAAHSLHRPSKGHAGKQ